MDGSVRRCRACGQVALVSVRAWDQSHSLYGIPTGTTPGGGGIDWICQSCGVGFTLRPPALAGIVLLPLGALFVLVGGLLSALGAIALEPWLLGPSLFPLLFGGVILRDPLWSAWVRWRNPIVPGAPAPEPRILGLEPRRRCSCGAAARCAEATASRTNGVYTGTEYRFVCDACARSFTVDSPMGTLTTAGAGIFLLWIGWLMAPALAEPWSEWACPAGAILLGALVLLVGGRRLLARVRHPEVSRSAC